MWFDIFKITIMGRVVMDGCCLITIPRICGIELAS